MDSKWTSLSEDNKLEVKKSVILETYGKICPTSDPHFQLLAYFASVMLLYFMFKYVHMLDL